MYRYLAIALAAILFASCNNSEPRIEITPKVELTMKFHRFDRDFFAMNPDSLYNDLPKMSAKYGDFLTLYTAKMVGIGAPNQIQFAGTMQRFVNDYVVSKACSEVNAAFPNLDTQEKQLSAAFSNYHEVFPAKVIPRLVSLISGFNQSVAITDSILAIGLDKYLGRDNKIYTELSFPRYLVYNFEPDRIPSDAMRGWATGEFPFVDSVNNLISRMVYEGTIIYLTAQMLPEVSDSVIIGFTPQQMVWCQKNEKSMWTTMMERKLLFSTDQFLINRLVNEAPFTNEFSPESPGRAAVWIGYRIVSSYMKNNSETDLAKLMAMRSYDAIFREAKYHPQ